MLTPNLVAAAGPAILGAETMGFCAAFTSVIRAVARPYLLVPAAVVALVALVSPPAIDDASAQGFSRMQSSRGGFGGGPSSRVSSMPGGMMNKSGRPGGNASNGQYPKGGMA